MKFKYLYIIILLFFLIATTNAIQTKTIIINGSTSGTLTNYPIMLRLYNTSGETYYNNPTIYLGDGVNPSWSDIRFTNITETSSETGQFSYWIENNTGTSTSQYVWVKIPTIPTTGVGITIWYNNTSASDMRNGDATFTLYDDFLATCTTKWTYTTAPLNTSTGIVNCIGICQVTSTSTFGVNYSTRSRVNFENNGTAVQISGFMDSALLNIGQAWYYFSGWGLAPVNINGRSSTRGSAVGTRGAYYVYDVTKNMTQGSRFNYSNSNLQVITLTYITTAKPVVLRASSGTSLRADWVLVRQYRHPEPYTRILFSNFTSNATEGNETVGIQFNDTSKGIPDAWNWSFKNVTGNNTEIIFSQIKNATFTFPIGNWSIKLNISQNGAYNISPLSYFINVSVLSTPPIANFEASNWSGKAPLPVNFTDISVNSPTEWNWSFGDGYYSDSPNPTHIFTIDGNYTVILNVTNEYGSNNITKYITVITYEFGLNKTLSIQGNSMNLIDYPVMFRLYNITGMYTNISEVYLGNNVNPTWSDIRFTNITETSGENNPLSYWIENHTGTQTYQNVWVKIPNIPPTGTSIKIWYKNSTAPDKQNGYGTFSLFDDFNGASISSNWIKTNSTVQNGNLTVRSYSNGGALTGSIIAFPVNMSVKSRSNFEINANDIQFFGFNSWDPLTYDGQLWHWAINTGMKPRQHDGGTTTGSEIPNTTHANFTLYEISRNNTQDVRYTYNNGTYNNENLQALSTNYNQSNRTVMFYSQTVGCVTTDWVFVRQYIYPDPYALILLANFTSDVTNGSQPLNVQFTDLSIGIPITWNWSFKNVTGNNTEIIFSQTQNPAFVFPVGNWSIKLNITDDNGYNISPSTYFINVSYDPPVANFIASNWSGNSPLPVNFTDTSTGGPTTWNWSFGEGNFSDDQHPTFIFIGAGNYSVTLNVSNSAGFGNITKYINVTAITAPIAEFSASNSSGYSPLLVNFTDLSIGNPISWNWSFGDGNYSVDQNPTYTFINIGTYNVRLEVTNAFSSDNVTHQIIVKPPVPISDVSDIQRNYTSMEMYYVIIGLFSTFALLSLFLDGGKYPFEKLLAAIMTFFLSLINLMATFSLAIIHNMNAGFVIELANRQDYIVPVIIMQNAQPWQIISWIIIILCFINIINCILILIDYSRITSIKKGAL
jgi:PKD repeat protein